MSIKENYKIVKNEIAAAARNAGREQREINLLAVSKGRAVAQCEELLALGHRCFGENRVQEAQEKWSGLKQTHAGIELHLIGQLQTNKVKQACALFDVIQTLDRPRLAEALARYFSDTKDHPPRLFIQINSGDEPQKGGVARAAAPAFIDQCRTEFDLNIDGLMIIPPHNEPPAPHFIYLKELADEHNIKTLSMGMSGDFQDAIKYGANLVRVGTKLFDEKNTQ